MSSPPQKTVSDLELEVKRWKRISTVMVTFFGILSVAIVLLYYGAVYSLDVASSICYESAQCQNLLVPTNPFTSADEFLLFIWICAIAMSVLAGFFYGIIRISKKTSGLKWN